LLLRMVLSPEDMRRLKRDQKKWTSNK